VRSSRDFRFPRMTRTLEHHQGPSGENNPLKGIIHPLLTPNHSQGGLPPSGRKRKKEVGERVQARERLRGEKTEAEFKRGNMFRIQIILHGCGRQKNAKGGGGKEKRRQKEGRLEEWGTDRERVAIL